MLSSSPLRVVRPPSLDPLVRHVAARWADLQMNGGPPAQAVLLGIDRSGDAKVTHLLFDASGELVAVAKAARSEAGERALRAEGQALRRLRATGSARLCETAPRAVSLERVDGRLVLVQTPALGRPMSVDYYSAGHVDNAAAVAVDFAAASSWLGLLHKDTRQGSTTIEDAARRWLLSVLDRYVGRLAATVEEQQLFDAVRARIASLRGDTVPVTAVHGDFWMGNILRQRPVEVSSVVDWELSRAAGMPLIDVFKFPTSYGLYLDRAEPWRRGQLPAHPGRAVPSPVWSGDGATSHVLGFGYTYVGSGWFPALVRSFVLDHLRSLGVTSGAMGPFFVGFLAEQVLAANTTEFRDSYRAVLGAFAAERDAFWVWTG